MGRLKSLIPDFDQIANDDKTSRRSRDASPSPSNEKEKQYRGGTLPKTNLKVFKPSGALANVDFGLASERPDGTTMSLGSISARGEVEKIKV